MKKQKLVVVGTLVTLEYPTLGKSVAVDYEKLTADMQLAAALHGIGQKLGDAKSGGTPAEKYEMACRIRDSLYAGSWTLSDREENFETVIEAVAKIKGFTVEKVRAALEPLSEEEEDAKLREWKAHPKVKAEIARARAAAAAKAAKDADDLTI